MGLVHGACGGDDETGTTSNGGGGEGGMPTTSSMMTTGGGGTGGTPIMCSMGYSTVPMGECDLLNDECPPGAGCIPVNNGGTWTTSCVNSAGLIQPGQPCQNTNECTPGAECIFNTCSPVCCPDTTMAPCESGLCNVELDYGPHMVSHCSYLPVCDLFDPTTCEAGADGNCYPLYGMGYSVCAPGVGVVMDGEPCVNLNQCPNNSVCYNDACHYACLLDSWMTLMPGEGGCAMTLTCQDLGVGQPNIGLCAL